MLKIMLGLLGTYIGICSSTYVTLYGFNLAHYRELLATKAVLYTLVSTTNIIQISVLMLVTKLLTKEMKIGLFSSPYNNFVVGFLFSLVYVLLSIVVVPGNSFLDNMWFDIFILPVVVFLPLMYVDYLLLCKLIKK